MMRWRAKTRSDWTICKACLQKQQRIDRLEEELRRVKAKLRYQERTAKEGPFGASTPSSKVWMLAADGNVLIATWPVTMWRVAVDPTTAVPAQGVTHLSTQAAAALYVPRLGDQARWRWNGTGWDYLFEEDSKYREMLPKLVDGQPVLAFGAPKD